MTSRTTRRQVVSWRAVPLAGCVLLLLFGLVVPAGAAERQVLQSGHVPAAAARLKSVGTLPSSQHLTLAIGLPLRNEAELDALLQQLYDPASPNYRHYLTPKQFIERFGPTENDYQALIDFAKASGLTVTVTHPNRLVLDVAGTVPEIEKTFNLTLRVYPHPTEARTFYAPDVEPSVDFALPILHISGLDNYSLPHPNVRIKPASVSANATPNNGSGPSGSYRGSDFRTAYVPGTTLTGAGQSVGLLQFDGFYASDIATYESQAGLPNVPLTVVPIDGGVSTPGGGAIEVSLDIEMVISMAPGISGIYIYEAPNPSPWVDLLSRMANDNLAKQLSCSWGGGSRNSSAEAIFKQMGSQGQSFFNATGDSDAFTTTISFPSDSTNITQVGGTTLTTGTGASYSSETVWNWGGGTGSSGGISTYYGLPSYQQGISMSANQGSTTKRNVPDVALTADKVYVIYGNGIMDSGVGGTSCAAPLWAGFTALVNQQAVAAGQSTVGFLNPAVYALGKGASYNSVFHDITTGNNYSSSSPSKFPAATGYDLCTGWGTPNGTNLINALAGAVVTIPPSITTQPSSQTVVAGATASYSVTASGTTPLSYQWTFNGTTLAGATTSTLLLNNVQPTQAGSYAVVVTNVAGSVTSASASLTVLVPPAITTQPANQTVAVGGNASFSVTATGTAPLSYQWTFNGTSLGGATTSTLLLNNVQPAQAGSYAAVVSNAAGSSTSAAATLTVLGGSIVSNSLTLVAEGCPNGVVDAGETVVMSFGLKNLGTANTANLVATLLPTGGILSPSGSQTYGVLTANGATVAKPFTFTTSGSCGGTNTATLQLQDGTANLGTITFSLRLGQTGVSTVFSENFDAVSAPALPAGWVSSTSGAESAWVSSTSASDTAPNSVFSPDPGAVGLNELDSPAITLPAGPAQLTFRHNYDLESTYDGGVLEIKIGSGAWTDILAAGGTFVSGPYITVLSSSWSNPLGGRSAWTGASGGFITTAVNLPSAASGQTIQLRWRCASDIGVSAPGWYLDTVAITSSNSVCCTQSTSPMPAVATQPNSQTVIAGSNVTFQVAAGGMAPLTYQWAFNGINLPGAANSSLTLVNVQPAQAGTYTVRVTNVFGSTQSSSATLTVLVRPSITTPPSNRTVAVGASTSFSVTAAGTAPMAYQWAFDGTKLAGATADTLLLTNVQLAQAGSYAVVVTNVAGSITSALATLTVLVPPTSVSISRVGTSLAVSFHSVLGLNYALEYKHSLSDATWTPLSSTVPGTGGVMVLQDTNALTDRRYYRLHGQ